MKRNQSMGGDANSLRGDPINGPNNTAEKNAAEKTERTRNARPTSHGKKRAAYPTNKIKTRRKLCFRREKTIVAIFRLCV